MILLLLLLFVVLGVVLAIVGTLSASGPMRKLAGGILLAVGILIATGSGICSLVIMLSGGGMRSGDWGLVAVIGGLPFTIGAGMAAWGRHLLRAARPPSADELRRRFD